MDFVNDRIRIKTAMVKLEGGSGSLYIAMNEPDKLIGFEFGSWRSVLVMILRLLLLSVKEFGMDDFQTRRKIRSCWNG